MPQTESDTRLLFRFVSRFPPYDRWKGSARPTGAVRFQTPGEALGELYAELPAHLPPLYEQLLLSYRWPETDFGTLRLLPNLHGSGLSGVLSAMKSDSGIWNELIPNGWIQFGRGTDINYDPVCFDIRQKQRDGDCRIVRLDHEEIICFSRIVEVEEIAPSFREFVNRTLAG